MATNCKNCGMSITFQQTNQKKPDGSWKWKVLNAETNTAHICPSLKTRKYCYCGSSPMQLICMKCGKPKEFCPFCRKRLIPNTFHFHNI